MDAVAFLEGHLACQAIAVGDCRIHGDGTASLPVTCRRCGSSAILIVPSHLHRDVVDDLAATAQATVATEIARRLQRLLTRLVESPDRARHTIDFTPVEVVTLLADNHEVTLQQAPIVAEALAALPRSVVERVISSCLIVAGNPDKWAFKFTPAHHPHITDLIFLGPDLLSQPLPFIQEVVAHEVAHIVLGHRGAAGDSWTQHVQEAEADELMSRWLGRPPPPIPRLER